MKKWIAMAMALVMVSAMNVPAFAAGSNVGQDESQNIDITAKHSDSVTTPDVYSVDIQWDNMVFTYSEAGTKDWNPETHTYVDHVTAGWDKTEAVVKATNHSNVEVNVAFSYAPVDTFGVVSSLSNTEAPVVLAAGEVDNLAGAASAEAVLTVSGTPNDTVTAEGVVIGTITVQIS